MCRLKFRPCGGSPLTVPTFLYVPDICKIAKRSGLDDGKNFIFTNSNVPLQCPLFIVPDICRIVGRSGINDGEDFIFTNSNVPLQYPLFIVPDICRIVGRSGLNDSDKLKY